MEGTAVFAKYWLCIEWPGMWPRDAILALPTEVQEWLKGLQQFPELRIQLIRKPRQNEQKIYLSKAGEWLREIKGGLAQLIRRDPASLMTLGEEVEESLVLVCTHGKRDVCCSKLGQPVYLRASEFTDHAWQSSHLGGHRFAPTLVRLPLGMQYGRVFESEIEALFQSWRQGELGTGMRGLVYLPPAVQAAVSKVLAHDMVSLKFWQMTPGENQETFQVSLESSRGVRYSGFVRKEASSVYRIPSCGEEPGLTSHWNVDMEIV